jgi:hypothetical protein
LQKFEQILKFDLGGDRFYDKKDQKLVVFGYSRINIALMHKRS